MNQRNAAAVEVSAGALWADRNFRYLIVWPGVLVLLLVGLFPFIYSLIVSFQNITARREDTSWHGFDNYLKLVSDDRFWGALMKTGIMTAIALPLELILGLALARLFLARLPGRQVFVALILLPAVISPIVAGTMGTIMFDTFYGPINRIVAWIIGGPFDVVWFVNKDPGTVYFAVLATEVWQWTPFMFLILLAAMSNVDRSQLEAAEVDGAGGLRIFWKVMLPAIKPVIYVALTIRGLDLFRLYDIVWAMTRGGPGTMTETISIYAYVQGFQKFSVSFTAAIAFGVIFILSVVVMLALKRMEIAR